MGNVSIAELICVGGTRGEDRGEAKDWFVSELFVYLSVMFRMVHIFSAMYTPRLPLSPPLTFTSLAKTLLVSVENLSVAFTIS